MEDDKDDRRRREDYEELDRLFSETDESLRDENLRVADESLKRVGLKAAAMWGEVGGPVPPFHVRLLTGLIRQLREDLRRPRQGSPEMLRKDLGELRSRFRIEARREALEGVLS